jgi:hypothetical protein
VSGARQLFHPAVQGVLEHHKAFIRKEPHLPAFTSEMKLKGHQELEECFGWIRLFIPFLRFQEKS